MIRFIFFLLILCMFSCTKEKVGHTKTFIKNTTSHTIKLLSYYGATLDVNNTKIIPPSSTIEAYTANVHGKTIDPCFGTLLQPYDSVLVTYDDTVKISHIKFNLPYNGTHRILFQSNRSISNPGSYIKEITNETSYSLEGKFTYTFVEQDYLDAK